MAFDAFLTSSAPSFKDNLPAELREQIEDAIEALMADPHKDGHTKVAVGFPFRYDSICYATEDFLVAYYFENPSVIAVYAIVPRAKR